MKKRKKMLKKDRKKSWQIFQKHHLEYKCNCYGDAPDDSEVCIQCGGRTQEKVVRITRTEHFFAGRMESYFKAHGCTPGMRKTMAYMAKKYRPQRRIKPSVISKPEGNNDKQEEV